MKDTKRKGIKHLFNNCNQMSNKEFGKLTETIKRLKVISNENSTASEKIDGFGFRFGVDEDNNFFVESSRSGPVYESGIFTNYTIAKFGKPNEISEAYESLFYTLKTNFALRAILQKYTGLYSGIKIVCECLFSSLGVCCDNGLIKFVTIEYDNSKLGEFATFSLIKVVDSDGNEIDCNIIQELLNISNDEIKFIYPKIESFKVDFSDMDELNIREEIYDRMSKCISSSVLGPYYEGIVFNVDGQVFKVITKRFKEDHECSTKADYK